MSNGLGVDSAQREALSALADGELVSSSVADTCAVWRGDASARSTWHAYQLIGDVLRSDDLATPAGHDAAFVAALRARLDKEPVVLAPRTVALQADRGAPPSVAADRRRRRWSWMAPSAVAAGFVAGAGVLVVTRGPLTPAPVQLAGAAASAPATSLAPERQAAAESQALIIVNGRVMRDARLDSYLAAHKQFAGSSVLGVPSGFLRNAAAEAPNR